MSRKRSKVAVTHMPRRRANAASPHSPRTDAAQSLPMMNKGFRYSMFSTLRIIFEKACLIALLIFVVPIWIPLCWIASGEGE